MTRIAAPYRYARLIASPICAVIVVLGAGCQSTPIRPDPAAPVVLTETQVVEVPVPVVRQPPADLTQAPAIDASALTVLPAGQGDYGVTRASLETIIEALRAAGAQLQRWRAWALPEGPESGVDRRLEPK